MALRSPAQIVTAAANDVHPPLYYLLLAGWARMVGTEPAALRAMSAVLGAIAVAGLLLAAHRMLPRHSIIVWLSGILAATAPLQVWYGQELRMYVLALAVGTALMWLSLRLMAPAPGDTASARTDSGGIAHPAERASAADPASTVVLARTADAAHRAVAASAADRAHRADLTSAADAAIPTLHAPPLAWIALWLVTLAALYTHYIAGAAAILAANAVAAIGLVARRRQEGRWDRRSAALWVLTQAAALVAFLPWLAYAWPALSSWPAVGADRPATAVLAESLRVYVVGTVASDGAARLVPLAAGVAAVGAVLGIARRSTRLATAVALCWVAAPPLLILLLSLGRSAWKPKFVLPGAPGFELLLALGVVLAAGMAAHLASQLAGRMLRPPGRRQAVVAGGVVAVGGAVAAAMLLGVAWPRAHALHANFFDPAWQRDDYRGVIASIEEVAGARDAVLLVAPTQVELFDYYARDGSPARDIERYPLPEERPPDPERLLATLDQLSDSHRDFHTLLYGEREADPDGLVEGYLDSTRAKAFERWAGDLRYVLWAAPRPETHRYHHAAGPVASFGETVVLEALTIGYSRLPLSDVLTFTATWRAAHPPRTDLVVTAQLLNDTGALVAQRDMRPVNGRLATTEWLDPEHRYDDLIALAIPRDLPPGRYTPILGLYDPATGERMAVALGPGAHGGPDGLAALRAGPEGEHLALPTLVIERPLDAD